MARESADKASSYEATCVFLWFEEILVLGGCCMEGRPSGGGSLQKKDPPRRRSDSQRTLLQDGSFLPAPVCVRFCSSLHGKCRTPPYPLNNIYGDVYTCQTGRMRHPAQVGQQWVVKPVSGRDCNWRMAGCG